MSDIDLSVLSFNDCALTYFIPEEYREHLPHSNSIKKGERLDFRFVYVIKGTVTFLPSRDDKIAANPGDIVYIPSDYEYSSIWSNTDECHFYAVRFNLLQPDTGLISNEKQIYFNRRITILLHDKNQRYRTVFAEMMSVWAKGAIGYKLKCQSIFMELLYEFLLENTTKTLVLKYNIIYKGIIYLENNYLSDITTHELSAMCGINITTFREVFHTYAGMSPIKYRNYLRIKKAAELLRSGDYNVTEAASAVNFSEIYYFSRLFKRYMGLNPKDTRPGSK